MKKRVMLTGSLTLALAAAAIGVAQSPPQEGVNTSRHSNLAAAQQFIQQAYQKIEAAQRVNHSDLGGHAKKAEELLDQANHELGLAADVSNQNHK